MMRIIFLGVALALATAASAQLYRWVDKDGGVHYTSTPPPSDVRSRSIAVPSPSAPAAPADEANAERKGPLTPAEQEREFRKRRQEAQKAEEKAAAAVQEQAAKQENCRRAQETLATLQSGQRISRTNAQGERYYLDDNARSGEVQAAQRAVQEGCG
jgi:hypothetical protein